MAPNIHPRAGRPPPGNTARVLVPFVAAPLIALGAWNYMRRGNILATQGVANVEARHASSGATSTHTPAYGGTRRDDSSNAPADRNAGKTDFSARNNNGENALGAEQRSQQPLGPVGREFSRMKYGQADGK